MNRYDKEDIIIDTLQKTNITKIRLNCCSLTTIKIFSSLYFKKKWKKWINTSGKNMLPPDFYHNKLKIMMDVMRIDDHARVNEKGRVINLHNERESKIISEMIGQNKYIQEAVEKGNVFINPFCGLLGDEDHNYDLYVKNFKRVVSKHVEKIEKYKRNHPGFKMIFFIFDESTAYMKCLNCKKPTIPGEEMFGEMHFWWKDNNMLEIIRDSGIDYIIWITPFKFFNTSKKIYYPKAIFYDISKINFKDNVKYDFNEMHSTEL